MEVRKGKVKRQPETATAGISNNTAQEFKKAFAAEAVADHIRCRSLAYCLRSRLETRNSKED